MLLHYQVRFQNLPLMVYREIAAHLAQVEQVEVEVVPQSTTQFTYAQSQVDSLRVSYPETQAVAARVEQILAYYGDRYGGLETIAVDLAV